jgi:hypothetical protein
MSGLHPPCTANSYLYFQLQAAFSINLAVVTSCGSLVWVLQGTSPVISRQDVYYVL